MELLVAQKTAKSHFFWTSDTAILLLITLPFSTTPAFTAHLRDGSPLHIFVTKSTSNPYRVMSMIYFSKRISFRTLLWVRPVKQFAQISCAGRLRIEGWRVGFSPWESWCLPSPPPRQARVMCKTDKLAQNEHVFGAFVTSKERSEVCWEASRRAGGRSAT